MFTFMDSMLLGTKRGAIQDQHVGECKNHKQMEILMSEKDTLYNPRIFIPFVQKCRTNPEFIHDFDALTELIKYMTMNSSLANEETFNIVLKHKQLYYGIDFNDWLSLICMFLDSPALFFQVLNCEDPFEKEYADYDISNSGMCFIDDHSSENEVEYAMNDEYADSSNLGYDGLYGTLFGTINEPTNAHFTRLNSNVHMKYVVNHTFDFINFEKIARRHGNFELLKSFYKSKNLEFESGVKRCFERKDFKCLIALMDIQKVNSTLLSSMFYVDADYISEHIAPVVPKLFLTSLMSRLLQPDYEDEDGYKCKWILISRVLKVNFEFAKELMVMMYGTKLFSVQEVSDVLKLAFALKN